MLSLAQAFLKSPELQVAVIGVLTWAIMLGLKRVGIIPAEGADWPKRLVAAVTAVLVGGLSNYVAYQVSGVMPDWGGYVAAVILAWIGATGLHTLTRRKKPIIP